MRSCGGVCHRWAAISLYIDYMQILQYNIKVIRKEFALRKKKEIMQHISKVIDVYNQQAELYKRLAEEVKRTSDAIKILDNRLSELLEEYNAAAALLEDEENE